MNMLGVARGDVYIRGYMAPIGAQWLIARSSRTVRTVRILSEFTIGLSGRGSGLKDAHSVVLRQFVVSPLAFRARFY